MNPPSPFRIRRGMTPQRKPKGYYFRHYLGGEFDGLKESVPMRNSLPPREFVNKQEHLKENGLLNGKTRDHFYVLREKPRRARIGETYVYEYSAAWKPAVQTTFA